MNRNICYLSPYYWPEEIGSSPYCTELAEWLRAHGHTVHVVAFRPHYPQAEQFAAWMDGSRDREERAGVSIERVAVKGRGRGGFKDRVKNDFAYLFHVLRNTAAGKYSSADVIVAYVPTILTLYGARAIRLRTGAPIVCIVHDIESGLATSLGLTRNPAILKAMRAIERIGLGFADRVIVLAEGMAEALREIACHRHITVLPIWTTAADFQPVDATIPATVMYSGNFGKKQNLDQLVPLIRRLYRDDQQIRVVLRGDGSERRRIQEAIEVAGAKVVFLPLAPAEQLMGSLQSASVHLVPQALNVSNYALPSKVFSIMAAGRPFVCIAEAGSPLDTLVRVSSAGICVPPGDEDLLYHSVKELACNVSRQEEMGMHGRRYVNANMGKAAILSKYEETICAV